MFLTKISIPINNIIIAAFVEVYITPEIANIILK
ncbi:hypothetical protein Maeo_0530 [Methanococcus aeolicus Nankai-3]|uniref:Uncharacterized protein n=1 Tax=Methanococcus aeolicus (strain ATCC BAA-1280 / DSM 17508 / OCM 812 / Nankai-3) TaxID=419665 RepID=A6UUE4_META3|nr:hypothetical protein Maeo_0530 [Methanococcus aeolicus Nankai-3]